MSEAKQKVLLAVLCGPERGDWINPELSGNIYRMARDSRFDVIYVPIRGMRPWDAARNLTLSLARDNGVDWLLSFDNDNFIPPQQNQTPLDVLSSADSNQHHVIGLTCGIGSWESGYKFFPPVQPCASPFREVEAVGGGVLMVHKTVWREIPKGPWFRWQYGDNELLTPENGGVGEDVYFSRLVRKHGLRVWTHTQIAAGHYKTTDVSGLTATLAQMQQQIQMQQMQQRPMHPPSATAGQNRWVTQVR